MWGEGWQLLLESVVVKSDEYNVRRGRGRLAPGRSLWCSGLRAR